jgi:hypothetical protein
MENWLMMPSSCQAGGLHGCAAAWPARRMLLRGDMGGWQRRGLCAILEKGQSGFPAGHSRIALDCVRILWSELFQGATHEIRL